MKADCSRDDEGGEDSENSTEFEILQDLCDFVKDSTHSYSTGVLNLALVEMCRLAGRNVSNNMNQSISSSIECILITSFVPIPPKPNLSSCNSPPNSSISICSV